jgi:hypothetical protein
MVALTDTSDEDDVTETVHVPEVEVKDIPMEEVIEDEETTHAGTHATPVEYGCGIKIRKIPYNMNQ